MNNSTERLTYKYNNRFYCDCCIRDIINKLGKYEELEEKGLLMRLPVAIGDTVYVIKDYLDCKYNYKCPLSYSEGKDNCEAGIRCHHEYTKYIIIEKEFTIDMLSSIGKTVFISHDEAEQKIKEVGKDARSI